MMRDALAQGEPIVDGREDQYEDDDLGCSKPRQGTQKEAYQQRSRNKQKRIRSGRNPEDLFRNVGNCAPAQPIDSLEEQQAHAFDESANGAKPDRDRN